LFRESISQRDVLQTDIRTSFNITVTDTVVVIRVIDSGAWNGSSRVCHHDVRHIIIPHRSIFVDLVRIDMNKLCASVYSIQLVSPGRVHMYQLHGKVVVHLVAIGTVDENGQVEVLVTESIGPAKSKLRHRRTDIGLVIVVDNAIGHTVRTTDILIFHITHPYGIDDYDKTNIGRSEEHTSE